MGTRRRPDAHVRCPTAYNSHYAIRLAPSAEPARVVRMNEPMPIDQSARAFAGGGEGPRQRDRRGRYFATGLKMTCRVARKMAQAGVNLTRAESSRVRAREAVFRSRRRRPDAERPAGAATRSSRLGGASAISFKRYGDLDTKMGNSYCSLSPARPFMGMYRQALTCLKSCSKNGDVPKSSLFQLAAIVPIGRHNFKNRRSFIPRVP